MTQLPGESWTDSMIAVAQEWIEDYIDEAQVWTWAAYGRDEKFSQVGNRLEQCQAYTTYVCDRLGLPPQLRMNLLREVDWDAVFDAACARMSKWTERYNASNEI